MSNASSPAGRPGSSERENGVGSALNYRSRMRTAQAEASDDADGAAVGNGDLRQQELVR